MKEQAKKERKQRFRKRLKTIGFVVGSYTVVIAVIYLIGRFGCSAHGIDDYADVKDFLKNYIPSPESKNTLFDIDDLELIRTGLSDPSFRAEYGVSEELFNQYLLNNI